VTVAITLTSSARLNAATRSLRRQPVSLAGSCDAMRWSVSGDNESKVNEIMWPPLSGWDRAPSLCQLCVRRCREFAAP
jgi:hypothetical protein